ncbi:hypothetical protein DYB38_009367 [Aphanomyces astaci]|uniref:BZIP domain-containing protein n=2 Tax=Aphanomyces astaci TaxID=112090 RepID=A0A397CV84_APHAT|nr:hypothetical protein DYB34_005730 [Aphanomyces astaci]RHY50503.1 hypothetical protein DYB38_009367 [Aphanomyces astaci]
MKATNDSGAGGPTAEAEGSSVWSSDLENDKDDDDNDKSAALNSEDKKTRRRAQIAKSARKHRVRQKAELHELRAQVQELTAALSSCRRNCRRPPPDGMPGSIPSLDTSDELEDFGVQASLRGLWLNAPLQTDTGPGPNVYHPYHHLYADPAERHASLLAIAKPAPSRMYTQILEDTHAIPSFPPYVDVRMTSMGENVSIKFCRVCEITNFDHKTVSDVFWAVFWGFGDDDVVTNAGLCRRKRLLQVNANAHYERVTYAVPNMPDVQLESLDVVTRSSDPNYTIFTWESIDQDDLFPASVPDYHPTSTTTIRREEIGRFG